MSGHAKSEKVLTKAEVAALIPDIVNKDITDFVNIGRPRIIVNDEHLWRLFLKYKEWKSTHFMYRPELIKSGETVGDIIPVPLLRPMGWEEFLMFCNVGFNYFVNMEAQTPERYDSYRRVIGIIRDEMRKQKMDGATLGLYKENIISQELGLISRSENKGEYTIIVQQAGEDDES